MVDGFEAAMNRQREQARAAVRAMLGEGAFGSAGARVVVLDAALASLPIAEADLGLPWNWRVGPAAPSVRRRRGHLP